MGGRLGAVVVGLCVAGAALLGTKAAPAQDDHGSIVGWGDQVVVAQWALADLVAVAAGCSHSVGLKTDGSIVAWGDNWYGQCTVPVPNSGFVAVAAGTNHSLGLKTDGSIVAWGDNYYGQCSIPAPNSGFIAIAGGASRTVGTVSG